MNIRVKTQDEDFQYDAEGRKICHWDHERQAWIILPEFENNRIKWGSKCSKAITMTEFNARNPNWFPNPTISVSWTWEDRKTIDRVFGKDHNYDAWPCPIRDSRSWNDFMYSRQQALDHLGTYCNLHLYCTTMVVRYNGEILFSKKADGTIQVAEGLTWNGGREA